MNLLSSAVGVSGNPCADTWPGDNAHSEPESKAVADYIMNHTPNAGWKVFLTMHSYSQLWMAPWGYSEEVPSNYENMVSIHHDNINAVLLQMLIINAMLLWILLQNFKQ